MQKKSVDEMFSRFSKREPKPRIELHYSNNFTLFVAVVLSAQSTDKGVNKITPDLFHEADNPFKMLLLGETRLKEHIKSIGLYNSKAKNIIKACEIMVNKHNNQLPDNFDDLCALPGVGRKSANVLMNSLFGHHTIAVDTHVFRVSNRMGLCKTKTPDATEKALHKKIPAKWKNYAHHWLVLHGRYVCKARNPMCSDCIVADICEFKNRRVLP
ncbi:endonuclease III [Candidatus Bandiella euplotis]|uniref:Endonuclease III n=1 Tax=Candidatus Bandiella euplotis TaxID=1664265 RepID=A0ABZ0UR77_9RICK|nr:endonuclease III [Candidatus Bandiella woodruffii]WPX97228.1 Endonuclease III [Candidatus Bandiella woodruffii]